MGAGEGTHPWDRVIHAEGAVPLSQGLDGGAPFNNIQASSADPGFLPGEGAKGLMTLYGMGMRFLTYANTGLQLFKMFIAILCLNGVEQPFKRHQCPFFLLLRRRNPHLWCGYHPSQGWAPDPAPPGSAPEHNITIKILKCLSLHMSEITDSHPICPSISGRPPQAEILDLPLTNMQVSCIKPPTNAA